MDENTIKLFGSKKTDHWQTPPEIYKELDEEFKFDCDPCPLNPTEDGLEVDWGRRCFVNPPYSKVKEFLKKAWEEIGKDNTEVAVFLTFSNTDTKWFHDYLYGIAELRFIKGRLRFLDEDGVKQGSAMRPSMIAVLSRQDAHKVWKEESND